MDERIQIAPGGEGAPSPPTIDVFFKRYADDALVFRVLMRFWVVNRPLSCATDIALPLGAHESYVRRALLTLVLEGFVTARNHNGEIRYLFTTDPTTRVVVGELLRAATLRGMCG